MPPQRRAAIGPCFFNSGVTTETAVTCNFCPAFKTTAGLRSSLTINFIFPLEAGVVVFLLFVVAMLSPFVRGTLDQNFPLRKP